MKSFTRLLCNSLSLTFRRQKPWYAIECKMLILCAAWTEKESIWIILLSVDDNRQLHRVIELSTLQKTDCSTRLSTCLNCMPLWLLQLIDIWMLNIQHFIRFKCILHYYIRTAFPPSRGGDELLIHTSFSCILLIYYYNFFWNWHFLVNFKFLNNSRWATLNGNQFEVIFYFPWLRVCF